MQVFWQSHKKSLLFFGVASSLTLFFLAKRWKKSRVSSPPSSRKPYNLLPKEKVLAYFRDFKVEILSILYDVIDLREELCDIYLRNHEEIPTDEHLRRKIFPQMLAQIKRKESFLLRKHAISREDLESSYEEVFVKDAEVCELKKEIDQSLENALNGLSPSLEIPEAVVQSWTADKCHAITLEIMAKSLIKIRNLYVELKAEGVQDFSLGNLVVVERSQALNLRKFKEDVLKERGFQEIAGHPVEIYTKLMRKYQHDSKEFSEKVEEIERNYQKVMEILSGNPEEIDEEAIRQIFYKKN